VLEKLEDIPNVGDEFNANNLHVTVLETDQTRVLKIRVEIIPENSEDEEERE
jgi:CBS domain containing-hemolysin-like protein